MKNAPTVEQVNVGKGGVKMCDCVEHLESLCKTKYLENHPKVVDPFVEFESKSINLTDGTVKLCAPVIIQYQAGKRAKHDRINMMFTYCPFCGEDLSKSKKEATT